MKFRLFIIMVMIFCLTVNADAKVVVTGNGNLQAVDSNGDNIGECPLKHTNVEADISGFFAKVEVTQVFENSFNKKIEAVYTFPLPDKAAVYKMVMTIGDRIIEGEIKEKGEAKKIYNEARKQGKRAALLDQERSNIFTQSVANIEPGAKIEIKITYLDVLDYNGGEFSFVFPTVVGPRFNPDSVSDKGKITPPITPEGKRAGHNINISVRINAGMEISNLRSELHSVKITKKDNISTVVLENKKEIPNRDFIIKYEVAEDNIKSGILTHKTGKDDGFFVLLLIPPKRLKADQIQPKEMVFVIDRSGSQRGLPIEKAKDTMMYILDNLNPNDSFQLIDFANSARKLYPKPVVNSKEAVEKAKQHISSIQANGGTQLDHAIKMVMNEPTEEHRLRIVAIMTDGLIGNDYEVAKFVKDVRGTSRWFPFGTGNSVNRFIINKMAEVGGGEPEFVLLNSDSKKIAESFYSKIKNPVLADISLKFDGVEVSEVYPKDPVDLWDRKPIVIKGRYRKGGKGIVTLQGYHGGKKYTEKIEVDFPEKLESNSQIRQIWAREKIEHLMGENFMAKYEKGKNCEKIKNSIIDVALNFSLMSEFTSFVAVEKSYKTAGGEPVKVNVPVEMPEGIEYEGINGGNKLSQSIGYAPVPGMRNSVHKKVSRSRPAFSQKVEMAESSKLMDSFSVADTGKVKEKKGISPVKINNRRVYPKQDPIKLTSEEKKRISKDLIKIIEDYNKGNLSPSHKLKLNLHINNESEDMLKRLKAFVIRVVFAAKTKIVVEVHLKYIKKLLSESNIKLIDN